MVIGQFLLNNIDQIIYKLFEIKTIKGFPLTY